MASLRVVKAIAPQDAIKFSFRITNPLTPQDSPGASISASGIDIPATAMDAPASGSGGGDSCGVTSSCSDPRDPMVIPAP